MIVLTALSLGYLSVLLYIHLGSQRVPRKRVTHIIAETWVIFALIFTIFALTSQQLGAVPRSSIANELAYQLGHFHTLPAFRQLLCGAALLLAIGLFGHLFWSLQHVQRRLSQTVMPVEGGSYDLDA